MSRMHNQYRELESSYNYIDKTECLEKEIERFPSVYIEGAAGCGKTTMMRMLLEKHPEVDYTVLWMDEDEKYEEYERYVDKYVDNSRWLILENVPEELPLHTVGMIKRSIRRLGGQDRIILIGRNEIPDALLGTFWNREMGLVTQNSMLFDQDEVECLIKQYGSRTSPEQLLRYTGGWAGIVDVILRLESKYGAWNPESCWHEMNRYIKEMILDTLQREEREILHLAQYLPWVDEEMCVEILGTAHAEVILGRMLRKGFLVHTEGEPDTRWSVAPIFCHIGEASLGRSRWMKIGKWYVTHDHRAEQLQYDSLMPEVQLNLSFMRPQILTEQWVEELKPGAGRLLILQETKISCLQGGEDGYYTDERIIHLIRIIKERYPDCAITLSIGEKSKDSYQAYYDAGADRYLLRHETYNHEHYRKLHPPNLSPEHRQQCLRDLKDIGYQIGCGFMVGSPYQTSEHLAEDMLFMKELNPHMIGIGPFIPHHDTPFAGESAGTLKLTLYMLGLIRLMIPKVLLPATTALGTIHPKGRELGILAGANVVMPNLSPTEVRKDYLLYDNKICTGDESAQCRHCLEMRMKSIGYQVVTDRGDSLNI